MADDYESITLAYQRIAGMREEEGETEEDSKGQTFEITKEDLIHAVDSEWMSEGRLLWDIEVKDNRILVHVSEKGWDD